MRRDFEYIPTMTLIAANRKARRRAKKSMLTGAMATSFASGVWQSGVAMFGLLTVTNIVQKRKEGFLKWLLK